MDPRAVLDDFSRYIVAWKLCATMGAKDVTATLDLALSAAGLDHAAIAFREDVGPRPLFHGQLSYPVGIIATVGKQH